MPTKRRRRSAPAVLVVEMMTGFVVATAVLVVVEGGAVDAWGSVVEVEIGTTIVGFWVDRVQAAVNMISRPMMPFMSGMVAHPAP